jgi:putative transposase
VHHGFCKAIPDWCWSSYNSILTNTPTNLQRQKVLEWFGGTEKFIEYHTQQIHLKNAEVVEYENLSTGC